nr:uncharacterized protein LOC104110529 [Nicotiana tomentosiformis]
MDFIGQIELAASIKQRFILVAIDYFTKWVEAAFYKVVTKNVVADITRDHIVCRFGLVELIITDNATNLNSYLMKAMCETFKIKNRNSTVYMPQMNGAVDIANKNNKKILRSTGETPYLLVYGTEVVIPAKVKIPSLNIIQEAELNDAEWIQSRNEQLALIHGKRINIVCHGQLYHNRMARAFNKKARPRQFTPGQLVLKRIFLYQDEAKGKLSPNWQGP